MNRVISALTIGFILAFAGCPSMIPCEPRVIQVTVNGSERQNPDDRGRPMPEYIRLYQLKSIIRLENASFEDIWKEPKQTLGEDLLHSEELTVFPSEQVTHAITRNTPNSYLVAVAIVRKPSGTTWRIIPLLPNDTGQMCKQKNPHLPPLDLNLFLEEYKVETRDLSNALPATE